MYDCSKDVLAFHDENVTLPPNERTAMRQRRDANRERLIIRLKESHKPIPQNFGTLDSYAMLTMVQNTDKDYDINDGVYFTQSSLKNADGIDMSPSIAKQIICDALQDDQCDKKPQIKKSCVRVYCSEGYHVDLSIYRIRESDGQYELAYDESWISSNAAAIKDWFNKINKAASPDVGTNCGQFRRVIRLINKFSRSRAQWKKEVASGFTITKLAEECYIPNKDRDDIALRGCMSRIYDRLLINLEVQHPLMLETMLTSGPDDSTTLFLRAKLADALKDLSVLDYPTCTANQAAKAWDKVFNTDFFSVRQAKLEKTVVVGHHAEVLANLLAMM